MTVDAIGYVRSDISGVDQRADEERLRSLAKHNGYNLCKTIVFGSQTDDPERRLGVVLSRMHTVQAVLVPSVEHFDGGVAPAAIARRAKVIVATTQSVLRRLLSTAGASR